MKQSNNYFQVEPLKTMALLLVAAMLLIIPNMNIYSSVSSYQTSSPSLSANTNYKKRLQNKEEHFIFMQPIEGYIEMIREALGNFFDSNCGYSVLSFKNKNYAKYDFSGFDN